MDSNRQIVLANLPTELLLQIYSYLSPEHAAVARVNRATAAIQDNLFWKQKYKKHFPHCFHACNQQQSVNWYAEFRKTYDHEYKDLPPSDRQLFSLTKESDIESLRTRELPPDAFGKKDKNNKTLLSWAQHMGNQHVLDYFYQTKVKEYSIDSCKVDVSKADENGRTILYWAIVCHQNPAQISLLLLQGSKLNEKYFSVHCQPVHVAAEEGHLAALQTFIEITPDLINQVDKFAQTPLIRAAAEGHLAVVEYLLQQKSVNLNAATHGANNTDENDRNALLWAFVRGHSKIVAALVKAGVNVVLPAGSNQKQAVHIAAMQGDLEMLQALIDNKPDLINQVDAFNQTPLIWAAAEGHLPAVEYLLQQRGVNLNAATHGANNTDENDRNALLWAFVRGHSKIVAALVKAGVVSTLPAGSSQRQAVHIAAMKGDLNMMRALIDNKPDLINQVDACGQTPLIWAAAAGHLSTVEYLLQQKGINLNTASQGLASANENGRNALLWAFARGHSNIVAALVKAGVNAVLPAESSQRQAVHIAAMKGDLNMLRALIDNKPDLINQVDACGQTPLIWAAAEGHLPAVEYLLQQRDVDLHAATHVAQPADENGRNALLWAFARGHSKIVAALVKAGVVATLPAGPIQNQTVHIAAQKGDLKMLQALIDNKPDLINQVDAWGQTPFIYAVIENHFPVVEYLLQQPSVNLNASLQNTADANANGKTALHLAASRGYNYIVELLLKHGMRPDAAMPIDQSKLNARVKAELELLEFIPKRTAQPLYKSTFTLFHHTIHFGPSRQQELDAANALKEVIIHEGKESILDKHKKILKCNRELRTIYKQLKIR